MASNRVKLDREKALRLYNEGLCDKDIAEELGVVRGTITDWRNRNHLPCNRQIPPKPSRKMSQIAKDAAEARRLGMNYGMYKASQREGT